MGVRENVLRQFEFPLPEIAADIDRISLEASGSLSSSFKVENRGGGELNGYLNSNTDALKFSPLEFTGNEIEINYTFIIGTYKPGEFIESSLLIVSNGGELVIPIIIEIIPPEIFTKDGEKIASLMDYMFFVKSQPVASRQLFTQKEFIMWLLSMNYEHMELYDRFVMDTNKERAVDNFLILNRLKRKAQISLAEKNLLIKLKYTEKEPVTWVIPFKLNGWGYIDLRLQHESKNGALKLLSEKLSYSDFDENGFGEAVFVIYPSLIKGKRLTEEIVISGDVDAICRVTVIRDNPIYASVSKVNFNSADSGVIVIENNTGRDVLFSVHSPSQAIKFEGRRYMVGPHAELPFEVKLSALVMAQLSLKRQPFIETSIRVWSSETVIFDKVFDVTIINQ